MQLKYSNYNETNAIKNLNDKINEKLVKNRRIKINIFDLIQEKRGIRFHKYNENFKRKIDFRYTKVPISYEISGIENRNKIEEDDRTPYCYNKNGTCPFWRKSYSLDMIFCDARKDMAEVDNIKNGDLKPLTYFKKVKILESKITTMHLFDMVSECCFN